MCLLESREKTPCNDKWVCEGEKGSVVRTIEGMNMCGCRELEQANKKRKKHKKAHAGKENSSLLLFNIVLRVRMQDYLPSPKKYAGCTKAWLAREST